MTARPLTVAWFSFFPVEWLPDAPEWVRLLPRHHPAPWQRALQEEFAQREDIRLHIIVLRKQFPRDAIIVRGNTTFHLLKTPGGLRAPSLFWLDTVLIRRVLAEVKPDVVHAWGTEHGAALVASRLPYPALVTVQGLMNVMATLFRPTWHGRLTAWLENVSLRRVTVATGESNFCVNWLRTHYPELDVRHVDVVPDLLYHHTPRRPRLSPRRFLYIADLDYPKGGDVALRALRELQGECPWELLVVGRARSRAFMDDLKRHTDDAFWQRVHFKQNLTATELAAEFSEAAVMLCPTRADTGPTAVKAAVAAGVPVLGSDVGGVPDYIVPGKNGFLFPVGDVAKCVEAIRTLVQHPLMSRGLVEEATLAEKRAALAPAKMAADFFKCYRAVAERAAPVRKQS
jgi:glycosyltransferase involved in cell wall biosynthesis